MHTMIFAYFFDLNINVVRGEKLIYEVLVSRSHKVNQINMHIDDFLKQYNFFDPGAIETAKTIIQTGIQAFLSSNKAVRGDLVFFKIVPRILHFETGKFYCLETPPEIEGYLAEITAPFFQNKNMN